MNNLPIGDNISKIRAQISDSAEQNLRHTEDITLLCVSKTKPVEFILEAYRHGERHFGESYAKEAELKIQSLKEQGYKDIVWHFIGPIQKNKTKIIAENFDLVESVDRDIIMQRLNALRPESLPPLKVMLQVNISDEEQQQGCEPKDIPTLLKTLKDCPRLQFAGFMGIARDTDDKQEIFASFLNLKNLYDHYQKDLSYKLILSIGMTHDLNEAVAAGSTEVRIGTAIFGPREYLHA